MDSNGSTRSTPQGRIATLIERKAALEAQIKREKVKENKAKRKEDNRQKILIGAAMLSDLQYHPELAQTINATLKRAILREAEREFLKQKGWLKD